jgi:CubicO group peptidase (beta-lactamase class C family)
MLRQGNWEGKQLLSPAAVRLVTSDAGTPGICGIGWWSNNEGSCARMPKDAFWGSGAGHQVVVVVPSLNLIAVRNGQALADAPTPPDSPQRPQPAYRMGSAEWCSEYSQPTHKWLFEPLMEAITDRSAPPAAATR